MISALSLVLVALVSYRLGKGRAPDPDLLNDLRWFQKATGWKAGKSVGREVRDVWNQNKALKEKNKRQEKIIADLERRPDPYWITLKA